MAVRDGSDPWVAGEVLQAADLNQTFASKLPYSFGTATPTTTDSGFLWYDSNSTPAAPKFWDGAAFVDFPNGLTLIASESINGSSLSINNCFTSDYDNYRIIVTESGRSTSMQSRMSLRSSGSDDSNAVYKYKWVASASDSDTPWTHIQRSQVDTSWELSPATSAACRTVFDLLRPQANGQTEAFGNMTVAGNGTMYAFTLGFSNTTQFDGMTFFASTGTITATIRIYGYKD